MKSRQFMRSKLFVPGSRQELFHKALQSNADAISFDLEDAVHETLKSQARQSVAEFIHSPAALATQKLIIVRVNGLQHPNFEKDLQEIVSPGLDIVNIPMVGSAEDIETVVKLLTRIEEEKNISKPIDILANIETPKGFRCAAEIACADSRVIGLQIGFADLFGTLGIDHSNHIAIHQVRLHVRMAAGEAGIAAYDAAFLNVKDMSALQMDAQSAKGLGYTGKSCIHPVQIETINKIFMPSEQELAEAEKMLEMARRCEEKGEGVFMFNGQMIDKPVIEAAEKLLQLKHQQT